ncbi:hypothetical protein N9D31_02140, partial [Oligoflexaceae bacterium]|nr:hypothetical protein [Oligoflexaceae bacterium]
EPKIGWELEQGELIRTGEVLGNRFEFRESSISSSKPSGDGISADGGDGISADGGDGINADGGDGISADGGDGISADGGSGKYSNQPTYTPGVLIRKSNSEDEFKNIIAFPMIVKERYEVFYANMAAFEFFEKFSEVYPSPDLVVQSSDPDDELILTHSVLQWFGNFQPTLDEYSQTLDIPFVMTQSQPWDADSATTTNVRIQVKFSPNEETGKMTAVLARFIISTKDFGDVVLIFNRFGGLVTPDNSLARFKPIIEIESGKGESLKLDISNFLFKNLSVFNAAFVFTEAKENNFPLQIWPKLRILDKNQRKFEVGAPFVPNKRFSDFAGQRK